MGLSLLELDGQPGWHGGGNHQVYSDIAISAFRKCTFYIVLIEVNTKDRNFYFTNSKLEIVQLGPRSKQSLSLKVWTKDEH